MKRAGCKCKPGLLERAEAWLRGKPKAKAKAKADRESFRLIRPKFKGAPHKGVKNIAIGKRVDAQGTRYSVYWTDIEQDGTGESDRAAWSKDDSREEAERIALAIHTTGRPPKGTETK